MKIQKLFVAVLVVLMMLCTWNLVHADQIAVGGKWVDGHSYSNNYGVNNEGGQSWGFGVFYDKDYGWLKKLSENTAIGLDPGMLAQYVRITRTENKEREVKKEWDYCHKEGGREYCQPMPYASIVPVDNPELYTYTTTEEYTKITHSNVLLLGIYPKVYVRAYKVKFFVAPIVGLEVSDDEGTSPMVGGMAGVQYDISKSFGVNVTQEELWTDARRLDITSVNAVFSF